MIARALLLGATATLAACSGNEPRRTEPLAPIAADAVVTGGGDAATTAAPTTQSPVQAADKPIALVTDPATLSAIAAAGGAYDKLLSEDARDMIVTHTANDVADAGAGDPDAGVGIAGNSHRLFDVGYLTKGYFELIGLTYRVDRLPVTRETCGDIRLVYRLAYRAKTAGVDVGSRLPMTVTIVLDGPKRQMVAKDDPLGCRDAAKAWAVAKSKLVTGPLAGVLEPARVRQVLTNTQVVRWPSAARPDLAGHAEYALRSYRIQRDGALLPSLADHSPDVAKIRRDPKLRERFLTWLKDPATIAAIDQGWAELPAELTASRAISVSPRGFARRANRLYRQIVAPVSLAEIAPLLEQTQHVKTPSALLRRLDEHSCNGCHQAQTIAGFHMLGEDGPDVAPGNAMFVPISPPFAAEVQRREALLAALARGETVELARPAFERTGNRGHRGARCGLGDPGFASWTCEAGLTCQPTDAPADDADVGECLPAPDARGVGDPCELGPLRANANPRRDSGPRANPGGCGAALACNTNRVGFPGGMCAGGCDELPAGGTCGVIAVLTPFNNCLARDRPFPECIAEHVRPAGLRGCDLAHPCRDDYVCARTPKGSGGCMPPYFLFQLRVDGHPPSKAAIAPARP